MGKDDARAAEVLKETTPILAEDRQRYPGWYLCPIKHRIGKSHLREEGFLLRDFSEDQFANSDKLELISELIWHHNIQIDPISGNLQKAAEQMINEDDCLKSPQKHAALLSAIMYHARWSDDESKFNEYVGHVEGNPASIEEIRTYAIYQQCLRARDIFDFNLLADLLARLSADEPIWQLRRAALYSEIGEYTRATKLIKGALSDLERGYRADRNSLWIKSCLAWASYIHDASQAWGPRNEELQPWEFQSLDINPKSEILYFSNQASDLAKSKREDEAEIRPSFEIGVYREGKNKNGNPANGSLNLLYEFEYVVDHLGLPTRLNAVNICADTFLAVLEGAATPSFVWYSSLLRVLHSHYDRAFERYFGRLAVAQMSPELARSLILALGKAIEFWNRRLVASTLSALDEDRARCIDFLRLLIVALSRLTVRMSEEDAHLSWTNARYLSTKEDLQHPWILEAINDLLKFSFQALPGSKKQGSIFEVIDLPLSSERNVDRRFAPDLISEIWHLTPSRSQDDARWSHRINQLIDKSGKDEPDRREAISRLSYLAKRNVLTSSESEKFAAALWSDCGVDGGDLPANTDLLFTAFAELPVPPGIDVVARIKAKLFSVDPEFIMQGSQKIDSRDMHSRENFLASFAHAREFGILISAEIAAQIFDQVVSWRPTPVDKRDSLGASFYESHNKRMGEYGGLLLSRSIVPFLSSDAYVSERLSQLTRFLENTDAWTSAEALPYFAVTQDHSDQISATIRSGLASARSQRAGNAAAALRRWIDLEEEARSVEVPRSLIEYTIMSIESGKEAGLHVLIGVIVKALDAGKLNNGDIDRIILALDGIRKIFQYSDVFPETSRAVIVSLIRASCVKLSSKLITSRPGNEFLQSWLEEGRIDPLPEVRFSLS